jgi:pilus assembly protein FimV
LQAEWTVGGSVGRLRREYTALIDPPFLTATKSAPIRAPQPAPTKADTEPELTLEEIAPIAKSGEPELLIEEEPAPKQLVKKEPELLIEEELEPKQSAKAEPELLLEEEPVPQKTMPTKVAKSKMAAEPILELEPAADDSMVLTQAESTPEKFELLGPPDHLLPGGAPSWASTDTYRVKRGDTAFGIARKLREDTSLSVEQVVLALYDSNPKAFFGNNINNLSAGKILKIPDREAVTRRSQSTASRKFSAQYDSWQEYKLKLASARQPVTMGEPPASTKAKPAAVKAKTKPPVQEKKKIARKPAAKPKPKAPVTAKATRKGMEIPPSRNGRKEELLRIVRSNIDKKSQAAGKSAETESAKGKQQLTEKVATLQGSSNGSAKAEAGAKAGKPQATAPSKKRLLQVENADMAQPAKPDAQPKTAAAAKPAPKPATRKPVQVAKKRIKPTKRIPPPAQKEESFSEMAMGIVNQILGNQIILIIVGTLVVLGGAIGLVYARRRKKSLSEFEESILTSGDVSTGEVSTGSEDIAGESGDTSFLSDFSQGGMGNIATDEVDPIAEADVYLAYGRDEQAEEILKDAIIRIPSRHELKEKLLEIYAQRSDVGAFETLAEELYAALEGQGGEIWDRVAGMGSTLNPGNPMFQGGAPAPAADSTAPAMDMGGGLELTSPATEAAPATEETLAIDLNQMQDEAMAPEIEMDVGGLEMDISDSGAGEETEVVSDDALDGLEFNLDIGGDTADVAPEASEPEIEFGGGDSSSLEFEPGTPSEAEPEEEISFDAGELSLDAGSDEVSLSMEDEDEFAALRENTADNNQSDLSISIGTEEGEASLDASDLDTGLDVADLAGDSDLGLSFGEETAGDVAVAPEVEEVGADGGADQWDEAATKLDLAKAYIDMGDAEGARSILEEVAVEGNEDQKRQAADLASQIS